LHLIIFSKLIKLVIKLKVLKKERESLKFRGNSEKKR